MKSILTRIVILLLIAAFAGIGVNIYRLSRGGGITWVKDWSASMEVRAEELGVNLVSLEEVQGLIGDGLTLILDARPEDEYQQGRIPGAVNLPAHNMDAVLPDLMMMLMPEQPVLVYCGGAECEDSLLVAAALQELGLLDISIFKGGMQEWRAHSLEEEGL